MSDADSSRGSSKDYSEGNPSSPAPSTASSPTRTNISNVFNVEELRSALNARGKGYYVSAEPLINRTLIDKLKKCFSIIPAWKMNILFNDIEANAAVKKLTKKRGSAVGSSSNSSVNFGRKYLELRKVENLIRSFPHKGSLQELKQIVEELMKDVSLALKTDFAFGETSFLRSVNLCPAQMIHTDNNPHDVNLNKPDLSLIVFLGDPAMLDVYEGGHILLRNGSNSAAQFEGLHKLVSTTKGHFILFRHDLPHNGAATYGNNERVFFSFSKRSTKSKKQKTVSTYILHLKQGETSASR